MGEKQNMSQIQNRAYSLVFVVLCLAVALSVLNWDSQNFAHYGGFVIALLVLLMLISILPYLKRFKVGNLEFEKESGGIAMQSKTIASIERSSGITTSYRDHRQIT